MLNIQKRGVKISNECPNKDPVWEKKSQQKMNNFKKQFQEQKDCGIKHYFRNSEVDMKLKILQESKEKAIQRSREKQRMI